MTPPPPGPTAESIKADAADAITAAAAAAMAAGQAEKDAIKYAGMLIAESVKGDSAMAIMNAQMILDAEMAANQAVMDADEALQDAMAAKEAAEALSEDDAERADAIAAADRAIEEATEDKKAAQAILDKNPLQDGTTTPTTEVDSLKEAVAQVKGANRLAEGYPMMPAAIGKRIAGEVMTAIAAAAPGTNGTIADATSMDGIMNDAMDIGAMTWAMIVGDDKIMMKRLGTIAAADGSYTVGNGVLSVASIAGMTATAVAPSGTDLSATGNTDGTGTANGSYKGIPGAIFCLGGTDGCKVTDGKLGAGWYFSPNDPKALYVMNPDMAGMYMAATMYSTYGYWLTYTDGAASGIALYSNTTANTANLNLGQAGTGDDATDVTARYSGSAVGISKRGDNSGQFTADVNLTAKFAVVPTLRGHISGFRGDAVGNWTVVLNETNLDTTAANFNAGTTAGGGAPGVWTAQGYGPTPVDHDGDATTDPQNQRPSGFHGRFSANFGDGSAAGAYATRAD
ncbi:MAG: hypothetical protein OYH76_09105 [Defluviicoccus sp.]|nr:hypothetical protein [Defluviicoccus sp.]MDE0276041.1 hypothetical protein [Defluviicoccus sp.]